MTSRSTENGDKSAGFPKEKVPFCHRFMSKFIPIIKIIITKWNHKVNTHRLNQFFLCGFFVAVTFILKTVTKSYFFSGKTRRFVPVFGLNAKFV